MTDELLDRNGKPWCVDVVDMATRPSARLPRLQVAASTADAVRFSLQQFALWLVSRDALGSGEQAMGLVEDFWREVAE